MARNAEIAAHLAEHAEIEAPEPVRNLDRPIVLDLPRQTGVGPAGSESDYQDPWAAPNHKCVVSLEEVRARQDTATRVGESGTDELPDTTGEAGSPSLMDMPYI